MGCHRNVRPCAAADSRTEVRWRRSERPGSLVAFLHSDSARLFEARGESDARRRQSCNFWNLPRDIFPLSQHYPDHPKYTPSLRVYSTPFIIIKISYLHLLPFYHSTAIMSFWAKYPAKKAPVIRIERVPSKAASNITSTLSSTPKPSAPRTATQNRLTASRPATNLSARSNATSTKETYATKSSPSKKTRKRSPAYQRVESDTSDEDTPGSAVLGKRQRVSSHELEDPDRRLRARKPFSEADSKTLIHAADIACLKLGFKPCFGKTESVGVSLHYPGSSVKERFVVPGSWIVVPGY